LAVYNGDIKKNSYGGDLGASLPQLFGRGAIAPIALLESAPMRTEHRSVHGGPLDLEIQPS